MFYRAGARKVQHPGGGELITKQSHKDECDIHNIMRQYQRTGIITHIARQGARYEDLPDFADYQEGLNTAIRAEEAFASLPSKVRDHYGNDPGRFLAAFSDDRERSFLEEFGLLRKKQEVDRKEGTEAPPA